MLKKIYADDEDSLRNLCHQIGAPGEIKKEFKIKSMFFCEIELPTDPVEKLKYLSDELKKRSQE